MRTQVSKPTSSMMRDPCGTSFLRAAAWRAARSRRSAVSYRIVALRLGVWRMRSTTKHICEVSHRERLIAIVCRGHGRLPSMTSYDETMERECSLKTQPSRATSDVLFFHTWTVVLIDSVHGFWAIIATAPELWHEVSAYSSSLHITCHDNSHSSNTIPIYLSSCPPV